MGRSGPDQSLLRIQRGDLLVGVGPVPGPVAVDPNPGGILPPPRTIPRVEKPTLEAADAASVIVVLRRGRRETRDQLEGALVGPACQCHGPAAEKEFAVGRGGRTSEPARFHFPKLPDSQRPKVALPDFPTGLCGEPGDHRGIVDGLKPG